MRDATTRVLLNLSCVPRKGFEPSTPSGARILSALRHQLRHQGRAAGRPPGRANYSATAETRAQSEHASHQIHSPLLAAGSRIQPWQASCTRRNRDVARTGFPVRPAGILRSTGTLVLLTVCALITVPFRGSRPRPGTSRSRLADTSLRVDLNHRPPRYERGALTI